MEVRPLQLYLQLLQDFSRHIINIRLLKISFLLCEISEQVVKYASPYVPMSHFHMVYSTFTRLSYSVDYVIEFVTGKDRKYFLNSCRSDYPSSEDEGQPLHKVVLITELCIIIRQLITLSSTLAPLFNWDSVTDVLNSALTPLPITGEEWILFQALTKL